MNQQNPMAIETYEYFISALRYKLRELKEERRVNGEPFTQKDYAKEVLGITPVHFSGIMNDIPGRRASEDLQERVAKSFGCDIMDFLTLGKKISLSRKAFEDNSQSITGDGNVQTGGNVHRSIQGNLSHSENPCDLRPDIYKLAKLMQTAEPPIEIKKLIKKYEGIIKEYDL